MAIPSVKGPLHLERVNAEPLSGSVQSEGEGHIKTLSILQCSLPLSLWLRRVSVTCPPLPRRQFLECASNFLCAAVCLETTPCCVASTLEESEVSRFTRSQSARPPLPVEPRFDCRFPRPPRRALRVLCTQHRSPPAPAISQGC